MLLTLAIFCWPQMMAMRKRFLMLTCLSHPSYMSTIPSCAMIQAASPFLGWSISSRVTSLKTWSPKGAPCSFIRLIGVFCACLSTGWLVLYEFRRYLLQFFMFAQQNSTNSSVGIEIPESISALKWEYSDHVAVGGVLTQNILWLISNFNIKLNANFSIGDTQFSAYSLEVYRSKAVQVLVIIIVFANCV